MPVYSISNKISMVIAVLIYTYSDQKTKQICNKKIKI